MVPSSFPNDGASKKPRAIHFASGDSPIALTYGVDDSSGGRVEAGQGDSSGEGFASDAFFDDVGDAVVDVAEQSLKAALHR
jgi:hypothetical protein